MERQQDAGDRRHELVLVERLVQEGFSQAEIEAVLDERAEKPSGVRETLRRLLGAPAREAA